MYELENEQFKKILAALKKEEHVSFIFSYETYEALSTGQTITSDLFQKELTKLTTYITQLNEYFYKLPFICIEYLSQSPLPTFSLSGAKNIADWFRELFFLGVAESVRLSELPFNIFEHSCAEVFNFLEEKSLVSLFEKNELFFLPILFAAFSTADVCFKESILLTLLTASYDPDRPREDFRVHLTLYALSKNNQNILSFAFWTHLYNMNASSTAADWRTLLIDTPEDSNIEQEVMVLGNLVAQNAIRKCIDDHLQENHSVQQEDIHILSRFLTNPFCIIEPKLAFLDHIIALADPLSHILTDFELFLHLSIIERLQSVIFILQNKIKLQESAAEKEEEETTQVDMPAAEPLRRQNNSTPRQASMFANCGRQTQLYPLPLNRT